MATQININQNQGPLLLSKGEYKVTGSAVKTGTTEKSQTTEYAVNRVIFVGSSGIWVSSTGNTILYQLEPQEPKYVGGTEGAVGFNESFVGTINPIPTKLAGLKLSFLRNESTVSVFGLAGYGPTNEQLEAVLFTLPIGYRPSRMISGAPISAGPLSFVMPNGNVYCCKTGQNTSAAVQKYFESLGTTGEETSRDYMYCDFTFNTNE